MDPERARRRNRYNRAFHREEVEKNDTTPGYDRVIVPADVDALDIRVLLSLSDKSLLPSTPHHNARAVLTGDAR
jgi:hypothetical protein